MVEQPRSIWQIFRSATCRQARPGPKEAGRGSGCSASARRACAFATGVDAAAPQSVHVGMLRGGHVAAATSTETHCQGQIDCAADRGRKRSYLGGRRVW